MLKVAGVEAGIPFQALPTEFGKPTGEVQQVVVPLETAGRPTDPAPLAAGVIPFGAIHQITLALGLQMASARREGFEPMICRDPPVSPVVALTAVATGL